MQLKENWDELPNTPSPSASSADVTAEVDTMDDVAGGASCNSGGGSAGRLSYHMEQEKSLPGIVMASGGQVFNMLYQLAGVDNLKYFYFYYFLLVLLLSIKIF